MNVFDDIFQDYVRERAAIQLSKLKDRTEWEKLCKEYDDLHDCIRRVLPVDDQDRLERMLHSLYKQQDIETALMYKVRIRRWYVSKTRI